MPLWAIYDFGQAHISRKGVLAAADTISDKCHRDRKKMTRLCITRTYELPGSGHAVRQHAEPARRADSAGIRPSETAGTVFADIKRESTGTRSIYSTLFGYQGSLSDLRCLHSVRHPALLTLHSSHPHKNERVSNTSTSLTCRRAVSCRVHHTLCKRVETTACSSRVPALCNCFLLDSDDRHT